MRRFRDLFVPAGGDESIVAAAPAVAVRRLLALFWPDLRPLRRPLLFGLLFVALVPALETVEILLFQKVVDDALVPQDLGALVPIAIAYLGLALLGAIVGFGDEYLATWVGERFLLRLRTRVYAHVQRLSPAQLDRQRLGDVLQRITGDIQAIEAFILGSLAEGLSAVLRILFFGTALFLLDWQLALASLVVVPAFWFVARTFARLIRGAAREKRRRSGSLGAVAEEGLSNLALVQSVGGEDADRARFVRQGEQIVEAELAATRIQALFSPLTDLIRLVGVLLVLGLGVWTMQSGGLSLGQLLVFVTLLSQMYSPIRELGTLAASVFAAAAAAERIVELLDREPAVVERPGARTLRGARGHLEFRGVTFAHEGTTRAALDDVSLVIAPGETVAVVGPSGAGKSTLASLLLRFADPTDGAVLLDGHDLRDLTLDSIRGSVALLTQDAPVPDLTVREVIAAGRPNATDAEIEQAARAAAAHAFVTELPDGYATRVGQRGRALSGGQRQRLALARTLLREAPVLVLDEPTTGLDADAAQTLLAPLRAATGRPTTMLITHDPAVMACADRVLRLEDGRLVADDAAAGRAAAAAPHGAGCASAAAAATSNSTTPDAGTVAA